MQLVIPLTLQPFAYNDLHVKMEHFGADRDSKWKGASNTLCEASVSVSNRKSQ